MATTDKAMNLTLKSIAGKGALNTLFVSMVYESHGGNEKGFHNLLAEYAERWPERIKISRPYNVSQTPSVEVLEK